MARGPAPLVVFFGEALPERFFTCAHQDFPESTLLLVMGTSLAVHPFASLVGATSSGVPRLLINRERVGENLGLNFEHGDGFEGGDCDDVVRRLCKLLGWEGKLDKELRSVRPETPARAKL